MKHWQFYRPYLLTNWLGCPKWMQIGSLSVCSTESETKTWEEHAGEYGMQVSGRRISNISTRLSSTCPHGVLSMSSTKQWDWSLTYLTRHHSWFIIKPIETKQLVPNKGSCSVWFGYNYIIASSSIFIIILYVNEMCLRNNSHTAIVPFTLWPSLNLVFCSQLLIVHAIQFLSIPNPDVISRENHYLIYKQTKLIVLSTNLLSCMIWYAGLHIQWWLYVPSFVFPMSSWHS